MNPQKIARITGWLFIATFVTALAARFLFAPLWNDQSDIVGAGSDTRVYWGAVFEFMLIVTNIGTAVVLYPIVKRQNEGVALGYVTARVMECAIIMVGVFSLLAIVTLRQDLAGAAGTDAASLATTGKSLVAVYDWAFLFGPGLVVGVGNGLLLGYLMYRSGLVPRRMAMLGLIGGPLLIVAFVCVLFEVFEANSAGQLLLSVPEIAWELSLGIYLIVKGFRPSAITFGETRREGDSALSAP